MSENESIKGVIDRLDTLITLLKSQIDKHPHREKDCPRLYEYLEEWIETVKAPKIKPKSLKVLKSGIENYIKPVIKNKRLDECKASEMLKAIEKCPYSYMRQVIYSIFRAVFRRAYQYDLIEENPAEKLDIVKHTRKKGRALTTDEQTTFINALTNEPTRALWLFYLLSGCRCGEALTLLWQDIDEKRGRVFIRGTKTETAERYIPLFAQLYELFESIPKTDARVFPYTMRAVKWAFDRIRKKSGLQFRIHDLRHTFATRCLESGIAIKTVAKWLGHKHTSTTDEIYSHLLTEFERQETQKFNPQI